MRFVCVYVCFFFLVVMSLLRHRILFISILIKKRFESIYVYLCIYVYVLYDHEHIGIMRIVHFYSYTPLLPHIQSTIATIKGKRNARLTYDHGSNESNRNVGQDVTGSKGRLDYIVGEGEGNDGVADGQSHHQRHPQEEEGREFAKRLQYVHVVAPTPRYHGAYKKGTGRGR